MYINTGVGRNRADYSSQKIYFDGFLPPSKLEVRSERLRVQTKRLFEYYNVNSVPCQAPSNIQNHKITSDNKSSQSNSVLISPRPFLVPSVIDALRCSPAYSGLVTVVPGEADLYCASYLLQHGGLVFTGDSDLLVHDIGTDGAVCFFQDVESTANSKRTSLNGQIYRPNEITDRLGLSNSYGLRALAFEIVLEPQGSFRKLLMQAAKQHAIKTESMRYEEFIKDYETPILPMGPGMVSDTKEGLGFLNALQWLDPRISEFVLQFPSLSKLAGQEIPLVNSRHVFLPFLIDCPVRTSAWETSVAVRQLSYGLLNLIVPENERCYTMFEHRRQQTSSSGREWQLPLIPEIHEACSSLLAHFSRLSLQLSIESKVCFWTACAVYHEVEYSHVNNKPSISDTALRQLWAASVKEKAGKAITYTWDVVQFLAQIEGSYYSFRMLKQIISLLNGHSQKQHFPESIFHLYERLKDLPSLTVSLENNTGFSVAQLQAIKEVIIVVKNILQVTDESAPENGASSSRKRRKRDKTHAEESQVSQSVNNPFDLLEVE